MGTPLSKETIVQSSNNKQSLFICYVGKNKEIADVNWVYCQRLSVFPLKETSNDFGLVEFVSIIHPLIEGKFFVLSEENMNKYKRKNLYTIQYNSKKVKTFDHILIKDNEHLSDIFLIEASSFQSREKNDNIFFFDKTKNKWIDIIFDKNSRSLSFGNNKINIPKKYSFISFYVQNVNNVEWENEKIVKQHCLISTINDDMGITLDDIDPYEYPFHFIHATLYFDHIFESGKICNYGQCDTKYFNEKTGKYLYPKINVPEHTSYQHPGIYLSYFNLDRRFNYPLSLTDYFYVNPYESMYGEIGFIFSLEEIFKFHVNIKGDQAFGFGKKFNLSDYYSHSSNSEIVVRANYLEIEKASALFTHFTSIELKFIYDYIPKMKKIKKSEITFSDVINFFKEYRNEKWYVRKSNLLKIVDAYEKNKKPLPPIFCFSSTTYYNTLGFESIYDTIYDTDSDKEESYLEEKMKNISKKTSILKKRSHGNNPISRPL